MAHAHGPPAREFITKVMDEPPAELQGISTALGTRKQCSATRRELRPPLLAAVSPALVLLPVVARRAHAKKLQLMVNVVIP